MLHPWHTMCCFLRPFVMVNWITDQYLQSLKKWLWEVTWIKYEHVKMLQLQVLFSPSFQGCAFYFNTCDLSTLQKGIIHTPGDFFLFPAFWNLTMSNMISWHLLSVIIYVLSRKQGQMLCQMCWQWEVYKNCEGDMGKKKKRIAQWKTKISGFWNYRLLNNIF